MHKWAICGQINPLSDKHSTFVRSWLATKFEVGQRNHNTPETPKKHGPFLPELGMLKGKVVARCRIVATKMPCKPRIGATRKKIPFHLSVPKVWIGFFALLSLCS